MKARSRTIYPMSQLKAFWRSLQEHFPEHQFGHNACDKSLEGRIGKGRNHSAKTKSWPRIEKVIQRRGEISTPFPSLKGSGILGPMNYLVAGLIGLFGGISSGLFGVGGGVVMVPAMLFFTTLAMRDTQQAVGTSLIVIIPTALIGALKHKTLGNINWPVALLLVPGAIVGGWIGASLTQGISSENLKRVFGGFIILVGCRLLFWK